MKHCYNDDVFLYNNVQQKDDMTFQCSLYKYVIQMCTLIIITLTIHSNKFNQPVHLVLTSEVSNV